MMTEIENIIRFYHINSLDDKYYVLPLEEGFQFSPLKKTDYPNCILVTREELYQILRNEVRWNKNTKQLEPFIAVSTPEEEIAIRKEKLAATDYKAIKFAEGELTEEEFAPVREQRRQWRQEINEFEKQVK